METQEIIHPFLNEDEKEVLARLESYADPEVTPRLYDLGTFLLHERIEQTKGLDTKAGLLAGFVGAIIALLLSSFSQWQPLMTETPSGWGFMFSGFCALSLAAFATLVAHCPRNFQWIDEKEGWLVKRYIEFPDQLQRYYLFGMYRAAASRDRINAQKVRLLFFGHLFLIVGTTLLSVPLFYKLWQFGTQPPPAVLSGL